ncbi:hypothetical protein BCR33DRAFT_850975 [Rhizoclosmatium globosum]|uniref:TPR-like protein n=1 Tax=Rhizoclosmatium globosum TaxID=329046 RepID=A0A1Y2C9T0_9FUNG|nr:hypothetical protein BCR33DRAFT_850975 [Rhizoclosmatium globosum]|eukprot:ORY43793.1 hypothetical protein BCR33DRAFT_850975 [Rhizoclosmatium globosum]
MTDLQCDFCNRPSSSLSRCTGCKSAFYCSANCQKKAWKEHKPICLAVKESLISLSHEADLRNTLLTQAKQESAQECAICLDPVSSPVILPCNHMFCSGCLASLPIKTIGDEDPNIKAAQIPCPLCRNEMGKNLYQLIYEKAVVLVQRANRLESSVGLPIPPEDPRYNQLRERTEFYCRLAREELAKIEALSTTRVSNSLKVDILLLELKHQEAIDLAKQICSENGIDRVSVAVRKKAAKACIALGKFDEAFELLRIAFQYIDPNANAEIRDLLSLVCKVEYHRGNFATAVEYGSSAIEMNRHFEGCYDYVILSQLKLGDKAQVEKLVKQSRTYETPWDPENKKRVDAFTKDILAQI